MFLSVKNILTISLLTMSILGLAACAFSTQLVALNPTPDLHNIPEAKTSLAIKINPVSDDRGMAQNIIYHKLNGYGEEATGGYVGNITLANFLQVSITKTFKALKYHVVNKGQQVTLNSRIIALDCKGLAGLIAGSYGCNLQVEFSLDTPKKQLWDDVISGYGSLPHEDDSKINIVLNEASNDLLTKLLSDTEFQDALNNANVYQGK